MVADQRWHLTMVTSTNTSLQTAIPLTTSTGLTENNTKNFSHLLDKVLGRGYILNIKRREKMLNVVWNMILAGLAAYVAWMLVIHSGMMEGTIFNSIVIGILIGAFFNRSMR